MHDTASATHVVMQPCDGGSFVAVLRVLLMRTRTKLVASWSERLSGVVLAIETAPGAVLAKWNVAGGASVLKCRLDVGVGGWSLGQDQDC